MHKNNTLNWFAKVVLGALATTFVVIILFMVINTIGINPINSEDSNETRVLSILIVYMISYFILLKFKVFIIISKLANGSSN